MFLIHLFELVVRPHPIGGGRPALLSKAAALVPTAAATAVTVVMLAKEPPTAATAATKAVEAATIVAAAPSLAIAGRSGSPAAGFAITIAVTVMATVAVTVAPPAAAVTAPCVVATVVTALTIVVVPSAAVVGAITPRSRGYSGHGCARHLGRRREIYDGCAVASRLGLGRLCLRDRCRDGLVLFTEVQRLIVRGQRHEVHLRQMLY